MIEARKPPQIVDLGRNDIKRVLRKVNFGHLGMCTGSRPYVVPIHFAYGETGIYFYTTEGMKTDIIEKNPTVCLQVEDIRSSEDWESVIIIGTANRLTSADEIARVMKLIRKTNPLLSPAWSVRWIDSWVRSNHEVVYRIGTESSSGRRAFKRDRVH
jgi:nitroimidazol reductase NimA-like FMN-containing flavoprotein (pyridoxamine 5'-phosphate oxidase superfamily)